MSSISVIIPSYNSEKVMGRCIKSLLEQTLLPDEIIVADGGSTDNTKSICDSFKDKRIKFITNTKSRTTGSNRNLGAEKAKNENLVFIDSDCVADRNMIKNYEESFKEYDCIAGNVVVLNPGKISNFAYTEQILLLKKDLKEGFAEGFFWIMNFGIKKRFFVYFPDSIMSEDIVFIERLKKKGHKIRFINSAVVFHEYPDNISNFFKKKVNYTKGFLEQKSEIDVSPYSQYGLALKFMDLNKCSLKEMVKNKDICMDCTRDCRFKGKLKEEPYMMQNIICLSCAVAVLEFKGESNIDYKEIISQ